MQYEEYIKAKDSLTYLKAYYKDGRIESSGYVQPNGKYTGFWEEYYSDGQPKWKGYHKNGVLLISEDGRIPNYTQLKAFIEVKDNEYVEVGKPFQFRIYIEGIHPHLYIVTVNFLEKIETDHNSDYPYTYTLGEESLELCDAGIVTFDFKEDCNSLFFIAHLPDEDGKIIFDPNRTILAFSVPIKREP